MRVFEFSARRRWLLQIALVLVSCGAARGQDDTAQYTRSWYLGMQKEAAKQVNMLTTAYELGEGQQSLLIKELELRIKDQWALMQNTLAIEPTINDMTDAEAKEALNKINEFYQSMPMNPDRIADWLEANALMPNQAPLGRTKFSELRHRDLQRAALKTDDAEDRVRISREMRARRGNSEATMNEDGQWLPTGAFVPSGIREHEGRWRVCESSRKAQRGLPANSQRTAWTEQPLPCFDDWRAAADRICRRARREKPAEIAAIWTEFTMRAWRRIALVPDTFNEIRQLESNEQVAEILNTQGIQTDLDALFQEFQVRVQAIEDSCGSRPDAAISAAGA